MSTIKKSALAVAVALAVGATAAPAFAMKGKNNQGGFSAEALTATRDFVESANRNGAPAPRQFFGGGDGPSNSGSTIPRSDYLETIQRVR